MSSVVATASVAPTNETAASETPQRELTYLEAIREAMTQKMQQDENVFLLGEDIGPYGGAFGVSRGMIEEFGPERILDTPISEAAIAGAATGAALMGMRPILEIMFMDFLTISMNQLVNQRPKSTLCLGARLVCPWSSAPQPGREPAAAAQHSQSLEAWFVNVPGSKWLFLPRRMMPRGYSLRRT